MLLKKMNVKLLQGQYFCYSTIIAVILYNSTIIGKKMNLSIGIRLIFLSQTKTFIISFYTSVRKSDSAIEL